MTREEAIKIIRKMLACTDLTVRANLNADMVDACHLAIKALEQEPFINKPCVSSGICEHDKNKVLDKIRAEIKEEIEQEEFARSVFRHEEKDAVKAEQCTGSIFAYKNVIRFIDKCKTESEDKR